MRDRDYNFYNKRERNRRNRRKHVMMNRCIFGAALLIIILLVSIFVIKTLANKEEESKASETTEATLVTVEETTTKEEVTTTTKVEETTKATEETTELVTNSNAHKEDGQRIVVIDAGHGGEDAGSTYGNQHEKTQTLELAKKLQKELEALGIKVYMTRDTDVWTEKADRVALANDKKADLLLSLHRNEYAADTSVKGFEAWVESSKPTDATQVAEYIMQALTTAGISKNRGVKFGSQTSELEDYYINRLCEGPSVLLELGFMSNQEDNNFYMNNMDKSAKGMADAILKWMDEQGL